MVRVSADFFGSMVSWFDRLFRVKSGWKNNSPIKNNAAYRSTERLWKW
ncbi:hypothetical protein [Scytonema sp. NUACC21]